MLAEHPVARLALVAALCVVLIVGAQALAAVSAPPVGQLSQSKVVGAAGFAYLGGLRVLGAGLLSARLDPQFHQYNGDKQFQDRLDLLPSIRLIQALNPQLEQPYYFVSYVLAMKGRFGDARALAAEGIKNNPTSGLLRANYVQILLVQDRKKNLPLMVQEMRIGLGSNITYSSIDDQFEAYGVFRTVARLAGDTKTVQMLQAEQDRLRGMGANTGSNGSGGGLLNAWQNSAITPEK